MDTDFKRRGGAKPKTKGDKAVTSEELTLVATGDATVQVFPSWVTMLYTSLGLAHGRARSGGGTCRLFAAPCRCSGRLKCPVFLLMQRERRDRAGGAEMGFYTLFIVALLQSDRERDSPGWHATLALGRGFAARLQNPTLHTRIIHERRQQI